METPDLQNILSGLFKTNEQVAEVNSTVFTPEILRLIAQTNLRTQSAIEALISLTILEIRDSEEVTPDDYLKYAQTINLLRNVSMTYVPKV